ncbi:AAA family ATPase [Coprobacillaceae bacterium CR2/5/TPMF4]|nr:AAA family ATPase [Coprobacillaceae bacterium CR2/5/TPMF4]
MTDREASDCFGFTQEEIDKLLDYYDLIDKRNEIKDWYDGYLFGETEIYNPWSALNYIKKFYQIINIKRYPSGPIPAAMI